MSESAADRAIDLLIANQPAEALRWSLAFLEREPSAPLALFVTSRALARMGSVRAAIDGLRTAAIRGATEDDLAIAIAALGDLQGLGADVRALADEIAGVIHRPGGDAPDPGLRFARQTHVRPLGAIVGERALVAKATQMIYESASLDRRPSGPLAFLAALSHEATRDLLLAFDTATVPAGHHVIEEGETADCAFLLAHGGAEIRRRGGTTGEAQVLAHLETGALFGELALLARLPSPTSVVTTRGSLLVVAWHDAIEAVGARHPDVRLELAAHCRRQAAANLGSALTVLDAVPLRERSALVDRLDLRTFERGERLATLGDEAEGLHLIVSGGVLLVARDGAERVVLQTLLPGDTVGETELVFCRAAATEAIAVGDTSTLFLPRAEFSALARDYPGILHGVYAVASRRNAETSGALDARAADVEDDFQVEDEPKSERTGPRAHGLPTQSLSTGPVPETPEAVPVVETVDVAGVVEPPPISAPPPPAPIPSQKPPPISARAVVSTPSPRSTRSSMAPATISQRPASVSRPPLAQRYARVTALVALAAGVCAVLAPRGDHGIAAAPPSAGREAIPPPALEPPPSVVPVTRAEAAAVAPFAPAPAQPAPTASVRAPKSSPASRAKHHAEPDAQTPPSTPAAPSAPPPAPAPARAAAHPDSPVPPTTSATARPNDANDFGGRE